MWNKERERETNMTGQLTNIQVIETQYKMNEHTPTCCSYCYEEKTFLMVKPVAIAFKGEVQVNVNMTNIVNWICLECLSLELDSIGHSVDIHEYD